MTKSTHTLSAPDVEQFCGLCGWAYETWLNHLELFDNNPRITELMKSFAAEELIRLSIISHEYSLHQIVKLHDKAVMNGNVSLGIDYVLKYGVWTDPVRSRLVELAKELGDFAFNLHVVRNKILSHNDLATIAAGAPLGMFDNGDDQKYFKALQEFVNTVHDEVIGGPWPFDDLVINDVAAFLAMVKP
jgi:hypothetical protein